MLTQSKVAPETRTPTHENLNTLASWRIANSLMAALIGLGLDGLRGAALGAAAGLALAFTPSGIRLAGRLVVGTRPFRAQAVQRVLGYLPGRVVVALARRGRP